jgi:putative ABC transport system permease protein
VDYISSRDRFNEETGAWERYVAAPIDSRIADIVTERLRGYGDTTIFGMGDNAEEYAAIIPIEMISPAMMEIIDHSFPERQQEYVLTAAKLTIDPENYTRLAELTGVPEGSNILLNHFAVNNRGNVEIIEPLIFSGQDLQFRHLNGAIRNISIHGVLTADQLPPELYPVNPAASVAASIIVSYGNMRGYTWLAAPSSIGSFMEYAGLVMAEFFPCEAEDTYMGLGFTTRVFKADDFARLMNMGIVIASVFIYSFTALLENIMCSSKSLFIGLPTAIGLTYLMHLPIRSMFPVTYQVSWAAIALCAAGVFAITWLTMRVAVSRLHKENIVENIRAEFGR